MRHTTGEIEHTKTSFQQYMHQSCLSKLVAVISEKATIAFRLTQTSPVMRLAPFSVCTVRQRIKDYSVYESTFFIPIVVFRFNCYKFDFSGEKKVSIWLNPRHTNWTIGPGAQTSRWKEETSPSLAHGGTGSEVEGQGVFGCAVRNVDRVQRPALVLTRQVHLELLQNLNTQNRQKYKINTQGT